ncbi:hypothetical protein DIPPA_15162 [Diplonema papillatum]|nr:hypothetical protein DIPPA_15162 [Diplonema papillatum]
MPADAKKREDARLRQQKSRQLKKAKQAAQAAVVAAALPPMEAPAQPPAVNTRAARSTATADRQRTSRARKRANVSPSKLTGSARVQQIIDLASRNYAYPGLVSFNEKITSNPFLAEHTPPPQPTMLPTTRLHQPYSIQEPG